MAFKLFTSLKYKILLLIISQELVIPYWSEVSINHCAIFDKPFVYQALHIYNLLSIGQWNNQIY